MFRGVDIHDWYRGTISDRRLLALIKHLPEDSAFKTAYNGHDWPLLGHLGAAMVNAINALRSDLVPGTAYKPILPPSAERDLQAKRAEARAGHDELIATLRGR